MLRAELIDDHRAGRRVVAEGRPADLRLELRDDFRGKPVGESQEGAVEDDPGQLPVPGDRVLSR